MGSPHRSPLFELTRVRVLLFLREPEAMFWIFAFPLVMAVILAFAFTNRGVASSAVGVMEDTGGELSRVLMDGDGIEVKNFSDLEAATRELARGNLDALVEPGSPPVIRLDEARSDATLARLRVRDALQAPLRGDGPVARVEEVTAVGTRYIDFLFPGLIGMNIIGTGLWGIGFFLVEQRQKKLLRRMLITPMPRWSYLASFISARVVFLVLEVGILTVFGLWALGVPFEGSFLLFTVLCLGSAVGFAGLGLLVAARARRMETVSNIINLTMIPMWLCSGVFFSYERFPEALHPLCRALPLTALNDALRAIMLDGEGLIHCLPQIGVLAAWGLGCFLLALRIFRWE